MVITTEGLEMSPPDANPAEVVYSVTSSVNGFILMDGVVTENFTLEDILSNSVTFVHSPGTESETVGFGYVLNYGGVQSEESQVTIDIMEDSPTPNGGVVMQVWPPPPPQPQPQPQPQSCPVPASQLIPILPTVPLYT